MPVEQTRIAADMLILGGRKTAHRVRLSASAENQPVRMHITFGTRVLPTLNKH